MDRRKREETMSRAKFEGKGTDSGDAWKENGVTIILHGGKLMKKADAEILIGKHDEGMEEIST